MIDLDFTGLFNDENQPDQVQKQPVEQAKPLLNRKFDIQREHQRMVEIFDEYQINIQKSETYLNKIMLGLRKKEDVVTLFSYAVIVIARLTNDKVFEEQALEIIKNEYTRKEKKDETI